MTNAKFVKTAAAVALGASVVTTAVAPGAASAATKYKVNSKGNLVLKSTGSLVKGWVEFGGKLYKNGKPAPAKKYKIMGTGASMKLYFGSTLKKGYKTANSKSLLFKDGKLLKGNKQTADRTRYYENGKLATGWDVVAADETKYIYKSGKLFKEPKTATRDGVLNYFENGKLAEGTKAFKDTLFTDGTVDEKDQVFEDVLYVGGKTAEGTVTFEDVVYIDGVKDTEKPEITAEDKTVEYGSEAVDVATLATVKDNSGEEIKAEAKISFDGKAVEKIDTKTPGVYTVTYTAKDKNGNEAEAKEIKVTVAEAAIAAVDSVEAVNATTVVVKFNKAVSKEEAVKKGVVSIEKVSFNDSKTTLSEDGKTLTLVATAPIDVTNSKVTVAPVTTAENAQEKTQEYVSLFTFKDTVAPTVVSATAAIQKVTEVTTNKVVVKFSEPVKPSALAYVNGTNVSVSQDSAKTDELVLTLGTAAKAGDALEIKLTNVKDLADNTITPNPATISTTVQAADKVAPAVTNVSTKGLTVTFTYDKEVTPAVIEAAKTYVSANGTQVGSLATPKVSEDKKSVTYQVTLNTAAKEAYDKDGVYAGTLYVQEGLVTDKAGNKSTATTQSVTFAADKVAPTLVSSEYKDGKLVLNFDEAVKVDGNTQVLVAEYNATTGFVGTSTSVTVNASDLSNDGKTATVNLGLTANAEKDTTYKVSFAEGAFKDNEGNKAAAFNSTITVPKLVASEANDTKAPTASGFDVKLVGDNYEITYTAADQFDAAKGEKSSGLDFSTILNIGNYTLDGKALPEGTTIATDAQTDKKETTEVTITIPKTSVKANINGPLTVTGLKDGKGNTLTDIIASKALVLAEGVAPELKVATLVSNTIVLGFSEEVTPKVADLEVKVNNKAVAASELSIAPGTGSDEGKHLLKVAVKTKDAVEEKPAVEAKEAGFYNEAGTVHPLKKGDKLTVAEVVYTYADEVKGSEGVKAEAAYDYILLADGSELKVTADLKAAPEVTSVTVGTKKSETPLTTVDNAGNALVQDTVIKVK